MRTSLIAIVLLIGLCLGTKVNAQTESGEESTHKAPTLQIGLDGILFKKGDLDAQLIMQMVAEAQRHVALKAVQNMFLKKLDKSGAAVYSFADNVIKNIVEEKDTEIRTKQIFENTVNIVFTYAFLEYYLQSLETRKKDTAFKEFTTFFTPKDFTYPTPYKIANLQGPKRTSNEAFYDNSLQYKLVATLMDMASLAISRDPQLKELGLMQVSQSATYNYLNEYNRISIKVDSPVSKKGDVVFEDMQKLLGTYTKMIGLVKFLVTEKSFRKDQLNLLGQMGSAGDLKPTAIALTSQLSTTVSNLEKIVTTLAQPYAEESLKTDIYQLTEYIGLLQKADRFLKNIQDTQTAADLAILSDLLFTFYTEVIPNLKKMTFRDPRLINDINQLTAFTIQLAESLQKIIPGAPDIKGNILPFIQLISKLYEFNKATTLSEYTKLIVDLENIFPNDFAKEALSIINSFIKDHVIFVKNEAGKEVVDFKVESFLKKMQEIKPYKNSIFQFHMTVGVNSGFFRNPIPIGTETINNFSYVGEKIGFKIKLYDGQFWKTRNPGEQYRTWRRKYTKLTPPTEPIISNVHLLAYGSGLLYNMINTSTQNNFNGSLVALGLGITFTRILDFNVSYCLPIVNGIGWKQSFHYNYWGVGFDVQFGAYLDRLAKKNSEKKIEKNTVKQMTN